MKPYKHWKRSKVLAYNAIARVLHANPDGISIVEIKEKSGIKVRTIRIILWWMEQQKLLGAYMRNGVLWYSYKDWDTQEDSSVNANIVQTEVVDG